MKFLILGMMTGLIASSALAQDVPEPDQEMSWSAFIRDCLDAPGGQTTIAEVAAGGDGQHLLCTSTAIMALADGLDWSISGCAERLTLSGLIWPVDYVFGTSAHYRPLSAYEVIEGAADIACSREYLNGDFEALAAR